MKPTKAQVSFLRTLSLIFPFHECPVRAIPRMRSVKSCLAAGWVEECSVRWQDGYANAIRLTDAGCKVLEEANNRD